MIDIIKDVEDIYNDFGNTLVNIEKPFALSTESRPVLGSCGKSNNTYRVITPTTGNDNIDLLVKLHEYGHVKCGHLEGIHEDMDANLRKIIINKDEALVKAINEKCGIDYASDILDKVISDPTLNHVIHNMAMDMEVNSSILDEDDLKSIAEGMNQLIYEEYMRMSDNGTRQVSMQELNNLYAKFDMKLIHPSTFGFESGLTYPDYLVQCILNLDKVMNELSNNYNDDNKAQDRLDQQSQQNQNGQGQGQQGDGESQNDQDQNQDQDSQGQSQGQPSDGQGNGSNSQSQDGNGQSSQNQGNGNSGNQDQNQSPKDNPNMPKTREEFDQMMENMRNSQGQNQQSQGGNSGSDQMPPMGGGSGGSSQGSPNGQNQNGQSQKAQDQNDQGQDNYGDDHGTDSRDQADDKRQNDLNNYAGKPSGGIGSDHSDTVRNYNVNNDPLEMHLQEIIRECRHKVIKRDFAKDMVHKYNRKILGKNNKMLSPTYKQKITKSENPTVAFVIDVSGSMDESLIDRCITTIRNQMKRLDRSLKYNIIAWDTRLCEYYKDIDFRSPIPKLHSCGGTHLAGAFDLFKKDFTSDAIMILISDFEDHLDSWHEREKTMNGYSMYGLCYGDRPAGMPNFKNFKVRYCESSSRSRSW